MLTKKRNRNHRFECYLDLLLLAGLLAFLMIYFDIRYLFSDTVITGGDTASWQGVADHLMRTLIPHGRFTGWDMGNFCGYPNFNFYFLPPFLLAVIPAILFDISLAVTLKWAIMSGIYLFPVAVYFGLRKMGHRFPVPIMGSAGALIFLFNESYTMFGGNTLSTFAGEFCYMFAITLFFYFCGTFYNGYKKETGVVLNGILLGLIGLSHLFVFIPALFLLLYAFFDQGRIRYISGVAFRGVALMAFWILPLAAYRHPYTTPVYMIWQEFVNFRYFFAGLVLIFVFTCPRFALAVIGRGKEAAGKWQLGFAIFCAVGVFAAAYLAFQYLILGGDLWHARLQVPDFSLSPLGKETARQLRPVAFPIAILMGLLTGALGVMARRAGKAVFDKFCRVIGSISFVATGVIFLLSLHLFVARSLTDGSLRVFLLKGWTMGIVYGAISIILCGFFIFSNRFGRQLKRTADRQFKNTSRFFMWIGLVFGCAVAYFSAHFLQVPDIRFLPPMIYALFFIVCAETLGGFICDSRPAVKTATAITVCYVAVIMIVFGAEKSENWFRSNNRGYEKTSGYHDFSRVNNYLKTVYTDEGIDPLDAPRVAYEKCDLYGPYGGDRAFESIPFFSGRQTLEGIHFAGSLASHSMAYLQTEFSRDIKTPKPQILSKVNIDALPAHFDLYNISQLIVMTNRVKTALKTSPLFEKEATFGNISLYRYAKCDQRYVDVPIVRPVLYTGKNWADDFYAWFQDPGRVDVLMVPEQFVKDKNDRAVFSGTTDSYADLGAFRVKIPDRQGLKIDTRLEHLEIRFTTNKIGLPHLVKVSYFPNWRVKGARGVYPVSPHLMMVIPREKEVVLTYGRSIWEIIGLLITFGWISVALGQTIYRRVMTTKSHPDARFHENGFVPVEKIRLMLEKRFARARPVLLFVVIIGSLMLMAGGAVLRNQPVRIYEAGYKAYIQGSRLSLAGKTSEAEQYFKKAIKTMRLLLNKQPRPDHRDVINCLLTTAMCYERLGDFQMAETWYRDLLKNYPRSRYVGDGYVKLARIYKQRMRSCWQEGLHQLRLKEKSRGSRLLKDGLAQLEKSLDHYHEAIEKDPYSVWAGYAREDLKNERLFLEGIQKELLSVSNDFKLEEWLKDLKSRMRPAEKPQG